MTIKCTRIIEFDAGHRVVGHKNKCKYLHGHRYILEVTAETSELDNMGMVIDFGDLKTQIKGWIDDNLDHNMILHKDDMKLGNMIAEYTKQKIYYLDTNPTAENIALHIKNDILPTLFPKEKYTFTEVLLRETPNCFVKVS